MDIVKEGSPMLKTSSCEVLLGDAYLPEIIRLLEEWATEHSNTFGVSAIQLREASRVCICKLSGEWVVMVNPVLVMKLGMQLSLEGCSSVPDYEYLVVRPLFGIVEYSDKLGNKSRRVLTTNNIRIVCHEVDHMDGKLIVDKGVRICEKKC